MERLTKKEPCSYTNSDFYSIEMDWHSIYNKLAEFEDFMEEKGFESLEELKDSYETIKKSQASTHSALMTINEELVGTRQFIIKQTKENQALKSRWEKLKKFVNMPKEIQQWDERFEVTVDSIKAKMKELEK